MKDAAFRADLASRREARDELARVHAKLAREMKVKVDATMKRLQIAETNAASITRVKAELEKDPEWNSLSARCKDLVQAIEENRKGAMAAVKARINPDVIKAKALPAKKETSK